MCVIGGVSVILRLFLFYIYDVNMKMVHVHVIALINIMHEGIWMAPSNHEIMVVAIFTMLSTLSLTTITE